MPPAGHSTPATARATATRPTECQTESGEARGEGRGTESTDGDFEISMSLVAACDTASGYQSGAAKQTLSGGFNGASACRANPES